MKKKFIFLIVVIASFTLLSAGCVVRYHPDKYYSKGKVEKRVIVNKHHHNHKWHKSYVVKPNNNYWHKHNGIKPYVKRHHRKYN